MTHSFKVRFFLIGLMIAFICSAPGWSQKKDLPANKQTKLGLYTTSLEVYTKWKAVPGKVIVVDVRTPEEYMFVGHPEMAHNIPVMLLKEKWYAGGKGSMKPNPDFAAQIRKKFKPTDTLFLMCRSGGRSAHAVNLLAKEGFKNVYTIIDGFEGGKVKNPDSYFNGKRMINGWRNSGAAWTYKVEKELAFASVLGSN